MKNIYVLISCFLALAGSGVVFAETDDSSQAPEISVMDTTVGELFNHLGDKLGEKYIVDSSIKGKKVPAFQASSWEEIAEMILKEHGLEKQLMDEKSKLFFIRPPVNKNKKKEKSKKKASEAAKESTDDAIEKRSKEAPSQQLTRLRTVGEPFGRWRASSMHQGLKVQYLSGQVRNVGSTTAKKIEVQAVLPDGSAVRLSGPATLDKYQTGDYSASPRNRYLQKEGRIRLKITCGNCRK